jgi:hypothetical protein
MARRHAIVSRAEGLPWRRLLLRRLSSAETFDFSILQTVWRDIARSQVSSFAAAEEMYEEFTLA